MNYLLPLKFTDIDFSKIVYHRINTNSKKRIIFLKYKDKGQLKDFAIQTPTLKHQYPIEESENLKYHYTDIPFISKRENKDLEFKKFLNNLDDKIVYDVQLNTKWVEGFKTDNINYQRLIRNNNDGDDFFRIKFLDTVDFKTSIKLNNQKTINIFDIPETAWMKSIIEFKAILISDNSIQIFVKPILISFTPIIIKNYQFLEESDNEDETDTSVFLKQDEFNDNTISLSKLELDNDTFDSTSVI